MTNTPYDFARFIKTFNVVQCSRCDTELKLEGVRTWFTVAEYLIRKGWSVSEDEVVCNRHVQSDETASAQVAVGGSSDD